MRIAGSVVLIAVMISIPSAAADDPEMPATRPGTPVDVIRGHALGVWISGDHQYQ